MDQRKFLYTNFDTYSFPFIHWIVIIVQKNTNVHGFLAIVESKSMLINEMIAILQMSFSHQVSRYLTNMHIVGFVRSCNKANCM